MWWLWLLVGIFFGGVCGLLVGALCRQAHITELENNVEYLVKKLQEEEKRCKIIMRRWLRKSRM